MKPTKRILTAFALAAVSTAILAANGGDATGDGSKEKPPQSLCTVTLATFNIRVPSGKPPYDWASRRDRVRQIIQDDHFDIFGVQEATKKQIDFLIKNTSFAKIGGGRNDFKDSGEHCCIFYDTRRFDLLAGGTFGLSEKPEVPGFRSWGAAYPRIVSWGTFRDKATGKSFCYYNTHLDNVSELARIEGIKMVVAHAAKNCGPIPLILTGDFNAYPDSETYRVAAGLLRDAAVISKTGHKGPSQTYHHWGDQTVRDEPCDFIFVSNDIAVLSHVTDDAKPLGGFASDHYPVIIELQF